MKNYLAKHLLFSLSIFNPIKPTLSDGLYVKPAAFWKKQAPMVRGRIVRIKDVPVEQVPIAQEAQWAIRGDRGLTTETEQPANAHVVAGSWWPSDYSGPPLVSLDAGIAKGFGLKVGDTVTLNVLGREITARVANLREINWASLSMNFTFVLTPNALAGAPVSDIATVRAPTGTDAAIDRAVAQVAPNISAIRVKEALGAVKDVIREAGTAIRAAAAVTLAAGVLVLAGALAAGRRQRLHDTVLFKVLGARRADLLHAVLLEYLLLGLSTGILSAFIGSLAGWAVLVFVLHADWLFLPIPVIRTVMIAVVAIMAIGWIGTARILSVSPGPLLRHE